MAVRRARLFLELRARFRFLRLFMAGAGDSFGRSLRPSRWDVSAHLLRADQAHGARSIRSLPAAKSAADIGVNDTGGGGGGCGARASQREPAAAALR